MHLKLHALLINKNILKINSLLIGCALWALFTSTRHTAIIISVPVAFYNTNTLHTITAPEKVALTLEGPCNIL